MEKSLEDGLFRAFRSIVEPAWIDYNGHMNVGYYVVAFDRATDALFDTIGIGESYRRQRNASVFVLEAHVTYESELMEGDPLAFATQVLDCDAKRLHLFHYMYHGVSGNLAATNELMLVHVDLASRRSSPFPNETMRALEGLRERHRAVPWPDRAGRKIAIRRG